MDPISTAVEVVNAIRAVSEMVASLRKKKKGDPETEEPLSEIEARLFALEKEVLSLEKREVHLLEENSRLRAQIRSKEERALERKKYQRKQVGRSWVLIHEDHQGALFCPACFAKDELVTLAPMPRGGLRGRGTHICPLCHAPYQC